MPILTLAVKSLLNRKLTVGLTTLSIALSIMLLLGVERLRTEAHESFSNTISGTDLIVGARSGTVQLLLYAVFRMGEPTSNISWQTYGTILEHPLVDWAIPVSLGDSHRGFRVMGTTLDYFRHYRFARDRGLEFSDGQPFGDLFEAVIGADVAEELDYRVGQEISLAHGTDEVSFYDHADKPFHISGILRKTGTPVDRTVHVSLKGMTALHLGWERGTPIRGHQWSADRAREMDLPPSSITAALIGLNSRIAVLQMQKAINEFAGEPLMAVVPGIALQQLWDTIAIAQQALRFISILVVVVGISGMATALMTGLNERRREIAVLRAVGARPIHVFALLTGEAAVIMLTAGAIGVGVLYLGQIIAQPIISHRLGLYIPVGLPSAMECLMLLGALGVGILAGCLPAYLAYRYSLANGMMIRI